MKFGATFSRRSVPQWRTHDLDYDEIKQLIKIKTSSEEGCSREFEANLLAVLDSELERIDEFVRCKAGEIERRLAACQRTVKSLSQTAVNDGGKTTSLKRFFKIEAEIDRTSKDAQLLARFVNAQYTGFQKLLKKHAKWCRLSPNSPISLSSQFLPRLETQRPFHRRVNFQHIMRQLSTLYNARLDPERPIERPSSDRRPSFISLADDNMDHVPMQSNVTYWVHSDNQVETELFLLKHLTLQLPSSSSGPIQQSTRSVYLDTKDWEVYHSLVSSAERGMKRIPHITWEDSSRRKDIVISIPDDGEYKNLPVRRKCLSTFLYSEQPDLMFTSEWTRGMLSDEDNQDAKNEWANVATEVREYIHSRNLHPAIRVSAERTGFVKVSRNTSTPVTSRVYASIDRNICSTLLRPGIDFLHVDGDEELVNLDGYKNVFPHAVLQIRWEGDSPRWLEELNGSHLIERVNGFSMYTHAVSMLVPTKLQNLPYWLPLLQKDIRKLQPVGPQSIRRRDSASPFVTTDSKTSSSLERAGDTSQISPATSLSPPSRKKKRGYPPPPSVIYWSEFENQPQEPYTVPVNESTSLLPWTQTHDTPMLRAFYKFYGAVESEVKTSADGLTTLFYEKQIESSSDEESTSEDSSFTGYRRDPIKDENERISRTALLNRGYCLCVVACTMILSVFGIIGLLLNGEAVGIGSCLVGFLIAMTLEIVSLVRFIMQGGHQGIAWIGFMVVGLAGAAFVPLVALTGGV